MLIALNEFHEAVLGGKEVTQLKTAEDITSSINSSLLRRRSSALRYSCLLNENKDDLEMFTKGDYYLVTSRKKTTDIVLVGHDGSFACTNILTSKQLI